MLFDMVPCLPDQAMIPLERHRLQIEQALLEAGATHIFDDLFWEIQDPSIKVWDCDGRAVAVTVFRKFPRVLELSIWLAAGNMQAIHETEPFVVEYAKMMGCSRLVTSGRPGWARANKANGWQTIAIELVRSI